MDTLLNGYCIAMQPICDVELNHVADELLYRGNQSTTVANVSDEESAMATARVSHVAFYEIGLEKLVGKRQVFLNTPRHWLLNPELLPPTPSQLVVEVLESVTADDATLSALQHIRSLGYQVALDDFVLTKDTEALLDHADIVKFDLQTPLSAKAVHACRERGLILLGEKVEQYDTYERLRDIGFTLFQGYFYARAKTHEGHTAVRGNNRMALLHLLAELQRYQTDTHRIERIVTQDAQLTFLLLHHVNSAVFPRQRHIKTVAQAIQALGLRQVRNLTITLLSTNNGPATKLLMSHALTRAGMCEHLALSAGCDPDSAFLTGLLSTMENLLAQPLTRLLDGLALSDDVTSALLQQHGPLGILLDTVLSFERADTAHWPALQVERYNQAWLESQVQATQALCMIE